MEVIKYIGIALLVIIGIAVGVSAALALGGFVFIGFLVVSGLEAIGLIEIRPEESFNTIAGVSFIIGLILYLLFY